MKTTVLWKGTGQESLELLDILSRACTCRGSKVASDGCPGHEILRSQRVIDGLLFARRIAERLILEEFGVPVAA